MISSLKKFGKDTNDMLLFENKTFKGIFAYSNANVKKRDKVQVAFFRLGSYGYRIPEMISDLNLFGSVFQIVQIMPYEYFEEGDLLIVFISSSQKRKLNDDEIKRWGLDFA